MNLSAPVVAKGSSILWDPYTLTKIEIGDQEFYYLSADIWNVRGDGSGRIYSQLFLQTSARRPMDYTLHASDDYGVLWYGENWVESALNDSVDGRNTRNQNAYFYHLWIDDNTGPSSDYDIDTRRTVYLACVLAMDIIPDSDDSYSMPGLTPVYGWVELEIRRRNAELSLVHSAIDVDGDPIVCGVYNPTPPTPVPPPPTPEPASGALLLSGCLLLSARRRRKAAVKRCQCENVASCQ